MKTETVTLMKGPRERFEFADMILVRQHDQQRTIQISRAANTYLVMPDAGSAVPAATTPAPKPAGVVAVTTTITDSGERRTVFGRQARRVKTIIDRQALPGACDATKQRIETDGWYIDAPAAQPSRPSATPPGAGSCADHIQATTAGDPALLGFPVSYTTTVTGEDGTPMAAAMEVTAFELTTLDAALFDIPPGLTAAADMRALSRALSDANEAKLAAAPPAIATAPRVPGVLRIGVPEVTNKTAQAVDTRALRQQLIDELTEVKLEGVPMVAATQPDLQKRAAELGYDYLLLAEVTELKASKPGRLGGLMRAASGVAGGGAAAGPPRENTESTLAVKLIQPDGRQRVSTTVRGKDGSGFSLKTGLGLAKFAGTMYLSMFAGPQMFMRLNGFGAANLGGMGLLTNPAMPRVNLDQTAGAASFLMQQAMTMTELGGLVGTPGEGPSYDESLGEAVQNAARAVQKSLQR